MPENDNLYRLFLVNCLWEIDLNGVYISNEKKCVFTFNPAKLFMDTNAPAWDGEAVKTIRLIL